MCPQGLESFEMKKGNFDFELYKRLAVEFKERGVSSLKLSMRGEPLLHPQLADMVSLAKEAGVLETMINTNGQLLGENKIRDLYEAGLDYLIISIDGASAKTYNSIRRGGDYDLLVENIENALAIRDKMKLRKPLIRLQYVLMPENEHEVDDYLHMWESKVDVITVNRYSNRGAGDKRLFPYTPIGRSNCYHPWRRLSVNWNGDAKMCCGDWEDRCVLGNLNDTSIYDIWHGETFNRYRSLLKKEDLDQIACCKDCFVLASYKWEKEK
ncbi:MAG: SPASM domain-containing protein [Pseudodesulfovibrio sp.]|nr:SPASM domain-containing protein [Pseudodesulfovibrio sp.]